MIIDFHTHCFPDFLAARAVNALTVEDSPVKPHYDGTAGGLIAAMDRFGIDKSAVLNIATNAAQTDNVNAFAVKLNESDRFYAFGSVHPTSANPETVIDFIADSGLYGIKLHPFYQNFEIDDTKMDAIYSRINQKKMILVFHAGFDIAFTDDGRARPEKLLKVRKKFPDIRIVAAHFGGLNYKAETFDCLVGTDIYLETSFGARYFSDSDMRELLNRHDNSRILFGTDGPWNHAGEEIEIVRKAVKSDTVYERIMGGNALALLGTKASSKK
jgi:predicted TIM-barrel fold metal-dependent hydrolase